MMDDDGRRLVTYWDDNFGVVTELLRIYSFHVGYIMFEEVETDGLMSVPKHNILAIERPRDVLDGER